MSYEDPKVRNYFQQQYVKMLTNFYHDLDFPEMLQNLLPELFTWTSNQADSFFLFKRACSWTALRISEAEV